MTVGEGLRLTQVDLDRQSCEWLPAPVEKGLRKVRVQIPETIREGDAVLRVKGIAPTVANAPRTLPRIYTPNGSAIGETVQVRIDPPLEVTRIEPAGVVQTKWATLPAPRRGELFEFLAVAPDWKVAMETEFPGPRVDSEEAVSLQFGPGEIQTRVKTLFQATQGRVFTVEADVAERWIVDAVRADVPEAVEDWSVERGRRGFGRKLVVQLARPLTAKRPLELTVSARCLYSPRRQPLTLDEMRPLSYTIAKPRRRILSLRATGDVQLRVRGAETLGRIDTEQLKNERFASFLRSSGTLLFLDDARAESLRVALRKRVPRFTTRIEFEAGLTDETLTETYRIECAPQSTRIERFWVRFSEPRDEPIQWAFADGKKSELRARRLDDAGKAAVGAPPDGEVWEIALGAPRSVPFEIRASRRSALDGDASLSLAWLPEAEQGEASVSVLANEGYAPTIVSSSLEPVVPPPVSSDLFSAARAVFAYEYRDLDAGGLVVRPARSDASEKPLWAWEAEIDSEFATSGKAIHSVRYFLENTGARTATVVLPERVARSQIREVRLDGADASWEVSRPGRRLRVRIALPPRKKHLHLRITFDAAGPALGLYRWIETPQIESDFDVLQSEWTVRLASGYRPIAPPGVEPGIVHRLASLAGPFAASWTTGEPEPSSVPPAEPAPAVGGFYPGQAPSGREGWIAFRFHPARGRDHSLVVVHQPLMEALDYAAFLAVVGIGIGVFRSSRVFWFCGATACFVAGLLVPPVFLGVVSGGLLGFLAVAVSRLLRKTSPWGDFEAGPTQFIPRGSGKSLGLAVAWILVGAFAATARADVPTANSSANRAEGSPVYPVLIPFDDESQAEATRILVPEPLYKELYRRGASSPGLAPIAIASASYDCDLVWSVDEEDLVPREWRLRYEVTNASQSAEMTLPIKSTEGVVRPDGVRVDGRLTAWRTADDGMRIPITEPGGHRVEVLVRPKVLTSDGKHIASVGIPPVLSAEATVTIPVNGPEVAVPTAVGALRRDRRTGKAHALLGPATSLTLAWQRTKPRPDTEFKDAEARCLLWLHVRPKSVQLDARLSIQGLPEGIKSLEVASNADLRLSGVKTDAPVIWTRSSDGGEKGDVFKVTSEEPFSRPLMLESQFVLQNARGTRRIEVPRLAPLGVPVSRTWLAVSVDPRLEASPNGAKESISVDEFLASWGEAETHPDFAVHLDDRAGEFLETRLRDDTLHLDQEAVYEFDAESVRIQFRAEIDTRAPRFLHQIEIAEDVRIESVSVHQNDVQRSVRWSRDSRGTVNVFLGEAVAGKHTLTLKGRMAVPPSREMTVPVPVVAGAEPRESYLLLARRFGANVQILHEIGCTPMEVPADREADLSDARFVVAYRADGKSPDLKVSVQPNSPIVDAAQIISPHSKNGGGRVSVELRLLPRQGVLDEIALGLSENIGTLLRIDPSEPYTIEESSEGGRLTIRPKEPIRDFWRAELEFSLKQGADADLLLGRVDLLPADVGQIRLRDRVVVLPTRCSSGELTWQRRHLRPRTFPSEYKWPGTAADVPKAFEAVSDDYDAVLVQRDAPKGMATVRFADIYLTRGAERTHGVAVYDVEPAGYSECPLALPHGCRLIRAFVGGMPVRPVPRAMPKSLIGEDRYSLPLTSRTRPQRISLVFEVRPSEENPLGADTISYPRLAYLPVQGGVATLRIDTGTRVEAQDGEPVSAERTDLLRLHSLASIIHRSVATIATPSESDLRWFSIWSRRLVAAARRLDPVHPEAKTVMEKIHQIASRWKQEDLWNEICIQSEGLSEPQDAWKRVAASQTEIPRETVCLRIPKDADILARAARFDEPFDSASTRYLAAAFLAVVIVYLAFALRGRRMTKWFFYPHFAGVLLGILWFAFFRPEIVGLLAMTLFTLASLRPAWHWVKA